MYQSRIGSSSSRCSRRAVGVGRRPQAAITRITPKSRRKGGADAKPLGSRAREAYDASFARTMEGGMADYETKMRAVKDELFSKIVGEDILEIGMGTGPNMRYYEGLRVVGVEPNAQSFQYAAANAKKYNLKSFDVVEGIGERLPAPDASAGKAAPAVESETASSVGAGRAARVRAPTSTRTSASRARSMASSG